MLLSCASVLPPANERHHVTQALARQRSEVNRVLRVAGVALYHDQRCAYTMSSPAAIISNGERPMPAPRRRSADAQNGVEWVHGELTGLCSAGKERERLCGRTQVAGRLAVPLGPDLLR